MSQLQSAQQHHSPGDIPFLFMLQLTLSTGAKKAEPLQNTTHDILRQGKTRLLRTFLVLGRRTCPRAVKCT